MMKRIWGRVSVWLGLLTVPALAAAQAPTDTSVTVTYIANEGVLISQGETQVLIDALHKPYRVEYMHPPPALVEQMMQGTAPFNSIDMVLVSHVHWDHFDASLVASYLQRQPDVTLFAVPQVVDSVMTYVPSSAKPTLRIESAPYQTGVKSTTSAGGATVTIGKITHVSERWRWIQNVGHIIEVGGLRFLHVGDPVYGEDDLKALNILSENIDVAILPSWFLTDAKGRRVIEDLIQPESLIAVHVSPHQANQVKATVDRVYPTATVFTTPLQQVTFPAKAP